MAKVDIWMPIYIGDYMADTMRLTTEQHGAYLLMLMEQWMSGPLPDDDEELAAITKMPLERWAAIREKMARFFSVENGTWSQKRLEQEKEAAQVRRESAAKNGKKGGRPKAKETPGESQEKPIGKPSGNPKVNPESNPGETSPPSPPSLSSDELNKTSAPDGAVSAPAAEQPQPPAKDPIPYQGIVDLYHESLPELRRVVELSSKRKAAMRQRHGGQMGKSLDNWRAYFEAVRASDFLMGRIPGKDWVADLDFLIRESSMISLLEGKYHEKNRRSGSAVSHPGRAPTPAERVAAKRAAAGASDLGAVVADVGNVRPHLVTGSGR